VGFQIYDERAGAVVPFTPLVDGQVSIYCCGLTVQSPPHLGHIRKEVVFDVLRRWFEACGLRVHLVVNVTDINEKIEKNAAAQGVPWFEVAYDVELELHRARAALGVLPPHYEPRASGHIPEQIELIQRLIEAGHAYAADDGSHDVYFDVASWPDYGELTRQRVTEMQDDEEAPTRGKHDPHDFALWKGATPDQPATAIWDSPWGPGRPGWHLECSAMALKYLGGAFDIHGGGLDLRFPHHENELAQSRAAGLDFAHYWMHNAFVTTAAAKMSKSLGNGTRVTDIVQRVPGRAVRLYLAAPHYRSTVEFSESALDDAVAQLDRIDTFLSRCGVSERADFAFADLPQAFVMAMDDDLGTPAAFAALFDTIKAGHKALDGGDATGADDALRGVRAMLHVLGLDPYDPEWADTAAGGGRDLTDVVDALVRIVLDQRTQARQRKDWASADALRDRLAEAGLRVEDSPTGPRWAIERPAS